MEEIKQETTVQAEPEKTEEPIKVFTLTAKLINALFAVCSLFFMVVTEICFSFGVTSFVFRGIMKVIYLLTAFAGLIWSYIRTKGKPSFEFFLNAAVFFIALIMM